MPKYIYIIAIVFFMCCAKSIRNMKQQPKYTTVEIRHDRVYPGDKRNSGKKIKYNILQVNGNEKEVEVEYRNLSNGDIRFLEKRQALLLELERKIEKEEEKRCGVGQIRILWDKKYREKRFKKMSEVERLSYIQDLEEIKFTQGKLTFEKWKSIKDIDTIRNLKYQYLYKQDIEDGKFPEAYIDLILGRGCSAYGLLFMIILYICFLIGGVLLIIYLCRKYGTGSILAVGLIIYTLCLTVMGPAMVISDNIHLISCNKCKKYCYTIKEPKKWGKIVYCMCKNSERMPGSYYCCCCFHYPNCCGEVGEPADLYYDSYQKPPTIILQVKDKNIETPF